MKTNFCLQKAKIVRFACQIRPPGVPKNYLMIYNTYEHDLQTVFT